MTALSALVTTEPVATPSPVIVQESSSFAGVSSLKGLKPGRPEWTNQDNFFVVQAAAGDMYCVLDGHGEHGHLVSDRIRQALPQLVLSSQMDMGRAFALMQQGLIDSREVTSIPLRF